MGFGFVEYKKPEQAQKALKQLQVRRGVLGHHGETGAQERVRSLISPTPMVTLIHLFFYHNSNMLALFCRLFMECSNPPEPHVS